MNTSSGVTFNHSTTIEQLSFLPKFNTRFGAASIEGDSINTYTGFYGRIPYESMMYGPEYNSQLVKLGYVKQLTRADGSLYDSTNQTTYNFKNPVKAFFQTGLTVQNGINYQANDQNSSFYLSAQAVNTSGTIPKDKSDRYSVRLGAARNYNKFSSSFSVGYTRTNTNVAGVDYNLGRTVYSNLLNTPGEVPITNFKNLNAPFANENDWYNAYYPNPYWQVENSRVKSTRDDILGSLDLNLKATSWLNFVYRVGITASNYQQKNTIGGVSFSDYEIYDPLGALNIASLNPNGVQPKMFDRTQSRFIIQSDFLVNMERKFIHNDLNARLVLGNSLNKDTRRTLQSGNANINLNNNSNLLNPLQIPGLYDVSGTLGSSANTEELIHVGKIGVYGSLQLGWKNYLFAELTARNDWVSVLDPSHRSVFSPGVNTSFVFTDAISFLKNISWLSFGKIFAGYTRVGNVNVQPYSLSNTFGQVNGFPYGNLTGLSLNTQAANNNLRPEIVVSNEAGLQLGLFKNRAIVGITHYNENAKDQVIPVQISSSTGFMSTLANIGAVKNSGWEFDARITPLLNLGPVRVNMAGNLTFYSSKVSDMDPNNKSMMIGGYANGAGIYTIENQPMRVLQVIDWKRDSMGHVIVDAITGQPSASDKVTNVGQSTPKIILALNPSFEYKSFGLNIIGEYRGGYVVYNNIGSALAMSGASEVTTNTGRQKFVYPNSVIIVNGKSVPNTNIVVNNASNGAGFFATTYATAGTPFVTSGAFWKVREVIFTYNIPLKTNKFIKRAVVGLTARNLFTFLPKDNVYADPEYSVFGTGNAQGISNENVQPPTRIFGATINVGF
ncbi:MAG TPA: hypothetical protein VGO09_01525 [Flavisolibacter sp.]|nr:hypothetical protein [Flavisolibacter sp.]